MLEHITFWTAVKNLSYIAVFIASIEWLGFNPQSLTIFGGLMLMDVVTGVARSIAVDKGNSFTSALLKRGLISKFLLLSALFSIALASKGLGYQVDILVQGAVNVLMLGELYSILGNVHSARTGLPKHEVDAVAWLLAGVKKILRNYVK